MNIKRLYKEQDQWRTDGSLGVDFGINLGPLTKSIFVRFAFRPDGYLREIDWIAEEDVTEREIEFLIPVLGGFRGRNREFICSFFAHLLSLPPQQASPARRARVMCNQN
jgi:hypothetical protein